MSFEPLLERAQLAEADVDAEIDRDLAHRVAEILEGEFRIAAGIADDDAAAAAPDHLVEPEILEVPAVGEIDVVAVVRGQAEHLADERQDRDRRAVATVGLVARAAPDCRATSRAAR